MICFRLKVETLIIPFRLIPLFLCFNLVQSPITGRSAGWVSALVNYLPVEGAIAENGGLFLQPNGTQDLLSSVPNLSRHRILLENTFHHIKQLFPNLHPSADNQLLNVN
jgi:hypothetical protein